MTRNGLVRVPSLGTTLDVYVARPQGEGPFPCVLVVQEIFGVNVHIRDVVDRLAQAGYLAAAPALFQRVAPGFEAGYTASDVAIGRRYKDTLRLEEITADARATLAYLSSQPGALTGLAGCIGFCVGGTIAYALATVPEIGATASFYGGGIPRLTFSSRETVLARTPHIHGAIALFFGEKDELIPPADVDAIETELRRHDIAYELYRYPAGHGFFCDKRADFDPASASDAWHHALSLFHRELG